MDALLNGLMLAERPATTGDNTADKSTRRLAGMTVRRTALRHPCTGKGCLHRNHRRDARHVRFLLDMLDLPDEEALPQDYDTELMWGSFSREEAINFR